MAQQQLNNILAYGPTIPTYLDLHEVYTVLQELIEFLKYLPFFCTLLIEPCDISWSLTPTLSAFENIDVITMTWKEVISMVANITDNSNVFAVGYFMDAIANVSDVVWSSVIVNISKTVNLTYHYYIHENVMCALHEQVGEILRWDFRIGLEIMAKRRTMSQIPRIYMEARMKRSEDNWSPTFTQAHMSQYHIDVAENSESFPPQEKSIILAMVRELSTVQSIEA
jgi:hypothetical protein